MKMDQSKKKKNKIIILSIALLVILILVGTSYAIWQLTLKQTRVNAVTTSCLKLTFKEDSSAINITDAIPISDTEGLNLTPFTFTIENTCNNYASYQVNLEELKVTDKKISNDYIKVSIENIIENLKKIEEVEPTIINADISHKLTTGVLEPKDLKTYDLRLWIDGTTKITEEVMNASWQGKITVTATYPKELVIPYLDGIKKNYIPAKEDKYKYVKSECNNNQTLKWNEESWSYTINSTKKDNTQKICKIYFEPITYQVVLFSEKATFEKNKVLTNLITNGSFENDFSNWKSGDFGNGRGVITTAKSKTGNKSVYIKDPDSTRSFWIRQSLTKNPKANDIIYQAGSGYVITNNCSIECSIGFMTSYNVNSTEIAMLLWKPLTSITNSFDHESLYYKAEQGKTYNVQIGSSLKGISEGYLDDIYTINLTDTFGSGNEPSQEWVDKYIPYFDTTANILVDKIEKLETKTFTYNKSKDVTITCENAKYKTTGNTIEITNATSDVYCTLK